MNEINENSSIPSMLYSYSDGAPYQPKTEFEIPIVYVCWFRVWVSMLRRKYLNSNVKKNTYKIYKVLLDNR